MNFRIVRVALLSTALALAAALSTRPVTAPARAQSAPTTIANGSFEDPVLPPEVTDLPGDTIGTPLGGWLFSTGDSGVTRRALTSNGGAQIAPPDGSQAAFVQNRGNFGRQINWTAGSYRISFRAMAETGNTVSFAVFVGAQRLITVTELTGNDYQLLTTNEFTVTDSVLPLVFFTTSANTARVQIDDIRLIPTVANVAAAVFNDRNANARLDFADRPLSNWTITLTSNDSGLVRTATTSRFGLAAFIGIPTGSYTLCETLQPGFRATRPTTLNPEGQPCYTLIARENTQTVALFLNTTRPAAAQRNRPAGPAGADGVEGIYTEPISPNGPTVPHMGQDQSAEPPADGGSR